MHSSFDVTFIIPLSNMPKGRRGPFVFRSVFNDNDNNDDDAVAIAVAAVVPAAAADG